MLGRKLVERGTLILFILALAATVMIYLGRGGSETQRREVVAQPTRVSKAAGATIHREPTPVPTPTFEEALLAADELVRAGIIERPPSLHDMLVAADEVQRARDFFERIGAVPTPTMQDILVAADQVQAARDYFVRTGAAPAPEPTLAEILIAADLLNRFASFVEASSAPPPLPAPTSPAVPPPSPAPASMPVVVAQPQGPGWYDEAFEGQVFSLVNQRRVESGLGALSLEPRLTEAAKGYARTLAAHDWFSHTGPDGSTLVSRVEAAGFPFTVQVGEVLAWGSDGWPPSEIVQAWMDSASHKDQILEAIYARAGIGCYFTQEGTLMVHCVIDFAG